MPSEATHETKVASPTVTRAEIFGWTMVPVRTVLGAVFLFAAYQKLYWAEGKLNAGPQQFLFSIKSFKLGLPDWLISFTTYSLPWTEVICAIALIFGLWTRAAAVVIAAMLVFFSVLIYSAMDRGLEMKSCGCFGDKSLLCDGGGASWCHIGENSIMLVMAILIAVCGRHVFAIDRLLGRSRLTA